MKKRKHLTQEALQLNILLLLRDFSKHSMNVNEFIGATGQSRLRVIRTLRSLYKDGRIMSSTGFWPWGQTVCAWGGFRITGSGRVLIGHRTLASIVSG